MRGLLKGVFKRGFAPLFNISPPEGEGDTGGEVDKNLAIIC